MADRIYFDESTGRHSFASAIEPAWHGKGQILKGVMTSEEAIREAQLDFTVGKLPVKIEIPGQGLVEIPGKFGTYRIDKGIPFGVVGGRYEIVQNTDAFEFFDAIVGKGEAIYETAGALYDGQSIFITAKLPDYIKVGKDEIEKYLFLNSTHDGSGSVIAAFTPVRVCCANTLNAALSNMTNKISIRHTKDAKLKLQNAHTIMGISNRLSNELSDIFNVMAKTPIVDKDLKKFIEMVVLPAKLNEDKMDEISTRSKNKVNEIYAYALGNPTQQLDTTRGSLWGAYNAITGYYQNVKRFKSADDKINSILMGGQAEKDCQIAFDLALELIG